MLVLETRAIERLASLQMQCGKCERMLDPEAHEEHATLGCQVAERRRQSSFLGD